MASSKSLAKKRHSDQWWENHAPPGVLRCTSPQKNGKQCNMEAVPGLNVCGQHGGKTPAAIAAAFTRLGGAVEDAADVVREIMNDPNQSGRDRLAAAAHVMKLLGMERERHEVTVKTDPVEELFRALLTSADALGPATPVEYVTSPEIAALTAEADPQEAEVEVVEAELVEEGEPNALADPSYPFPGTGDRPNPHTEYVVGSMSSRPPKHLRDALDQLI